MTRVPGVSGCGIELNPAQAELARANRAANGLDGLTIVTGDIAMVVPDGVFDHAFANPPYHPDSGSVSPNPVRSLAKQASIELLTHWANALARPLRLRGTLTFILPAASLPACIAAMAASGCSVDAILPLWPKAGTPAKLIVVRGIKGGRGRMRLMPGLVLHHPAGRFTPAADAILRDAGALSLDH